MLIKSFKAGQCAATTDMWTDDYKKRSYSAFTVHYIDDNWNIIKRVLFTSEFCDGKKSGENIRKDLLQRFVNMGFESDWLKAIKFVTDQGANIVKALEPFTRFNCSAHLLNTVLRNTFQKEFMTEQAEDVETILCTTKALVTYLKQSNKVSLLKKTVKQDIETRWNSKYDMLVSVYEQRVDIFGDPVLDDFLKTKYDLDFDLMYELILVLKIFKEASDDLERDATVTMPNVVLWYHKIKKYLSELNPDSSASISLLKERTLNFLERKFLLTMEHKIATFLSPQFKKLKMLTDQEKIEVTEEIKIKIEFIKNDANCTQEIIERNTSAASSAPPKPKRAKTCFDEFGDSSESEEEPRIESEIEEYLKYKVIKDEPILEFWKKNVKKYPDLSILAKKILCVPASSASSERNFSTAGIVVDKRRSNIKPNKVDALLFMHDNLKIK